MKQLFISIVFTFFFFFSTRPVLSEESPGNLVELAEKTFDSLSPNEKTLIRSAAQGEWADYSGDSEALIRAELIIWLCTDKKACQSITFRGIRLKGKSETPVNIYGILNLENAKVPFPLIIEYSVFYEEIILKNANLHSLSLTGSEIVSLDGAGLLIEKDLSMDDVFFSGLLSLYQANIGGELNCKKGMFFNENSIALSAGGSQIGGNVSMNDVKCKGRVKFIQANIGGNLICDKGEFLNGKDIALDAGGSQIGGNVSMNDVTCIGEVGFIKAKIGGDLNCEKGEFLNGKDIALDADGLQTGGSVFMKDVTCIGEVRFVGANIGGDLNCKKGEFVNENSIALNAGGSQIGGSVFMNDVKCKGRVKFIQANIGGDLVCDQGEFVNENSIALNAGGSQIGGSVFMKKVEFLGWVNLVQAKIGANLICEGTTFNYPRGSALLAFDVNIKGNVFLEDLTVRGSINFQSASIHGMFYWKNKEGKSAPTLLNLQGADVQTLKLDAIKNCPELVVEFNELTYHWIVNILTTTPCLLELLSRQKDFFSQPYLQLAKVLQGSGREKEALKVLIAKEEKRLKQPDLPLSEKVWMRISGPLMDYGYSPLKVLGIAFLLSLLCWVVFIFAWHRDSIISDTWLPPSKKSKSFYVYLLLFCYAVDALIPIIKLGWSNSFKPSEESAGIRVWIGTYKILGWLLSIVLLAGLTKLIPNI